MFECSGHVSLSVQVNPLVPTLTDDATAAGPGAPAALLSPAVNDSTEALEEPVQPAETVTVAAADVDAHAPPVDEDHVDTLRAAGETAPEVLGNLAPDPPVMDAAASVSVAPKALAALKVRATILLLPSHTGESFSNTLVTLSFS